MYASHRFVGPKPCAPVFELTDFNMQQQPSETAAHPSEMSYEDGSLGLYNVIVPRAAREYEDKISRAERSKLEELRDAVERVLGTLSPDSFIAGGALTSLISKDPINDIDVFTTASGRLISILHDLGHDPYYENSFVANVDIPELAKFTPKLQIIKTSITLKDYFGELDNVANGITLGSRNATHVLDSLICDAAAIALARKKIIRVVNYAYPRQNLARALKYISRGWKIEADSLAQLAIRGGADLDATINGVGVDRFSGLKPVDLEMFSFLSEK